MSLFPVSPADAYFTCAMLMTSFIGFVADYVTSEMCFGRGAKEGNKLQAWLQSKLGHPLATFIQAGIFMAVVGLLGTFVGSWIGAIPGIGITIGKAWQSWKNYKLYKSLKGPTF